MPVRPSGSGKSTLLRIIAGIETPESGRDFWNGEDLTDVPVHKRGLGLMFQDYALFPHKNVFENVAFGLKMQGINSQSINKRVGEALELVNLSKFAKRQVTDLSGGEQQRVALARALAPNPKLIMFDEPLGALDRTLREQLLNELRDLLHVTRIPAIYVTHDQEEAFAIGQEIILTNEGVIVQKGKPEDVYQHPANAWVAQFLGQPNLVAGVVKSLNPLRIETEIGSLSIHQPQCDSLHIGSQVTVLIPPLAIQSGISGENIIRGTIMDVVYKGQENQVFLKIKEFTLQFFSSQSYKIGEQIELALDPKKLLCLDKEKE